MLMSSLARFGVWLRIKRNFYLYWLAITGIPLVALAIWLFGDADQSPGSVLLLTLMTFLVSLVSGFFMWHWFEPMRRDNRDDAA